MLTISKNANPNYLAKVVKLKNGRKHNNADRLKCFTIDFQNVITDLSYNDGDVVIYFPVESQINLTLLSYINGFSKQELNNNKEVKGFFDNKGRVRAISLRGEKSQGFILKLQVFTDWLLTIYPDLKAEHINYNEDQEFDFFSETEICKKYVVTLNMFPYRDNTHKIMRETRIVENQFRLHNDTENLRKNINKISPDEFIGIHYKKHGTSWVVGNVLTKRKLSIFEKLLLKLRVKIKTEEYDYIYSSRKVIKNAVENKKQNHFFGYDLWNDVKERIKDKIPKGYTLYGEAVGFTKDGAYIQKGYDYGCEIGEMNLYVYRITLTNSEGFVIELDDMQIKDFCEKTGLNYASTFIYYGKAKDLYPNISVTEHWHENFLRQLEKDYNDKNCYMCVNKVPEEGIILRRMNSFNYEAYKLKSAKFLEYETKQLDNEEVNIES